MRLASSVATLVILSSGLAAHADSFTFSFGDSSSSFSGTGTLTTGTMQAPGQYLITGVTGTADSNGVDQVITSILDPGVFPTPSNGGTFPANDNVLFVTNSIGTLSQNGLSFILADGAQINLFNDGPGDNAFLLNADGTSLFEDVPVQIAEVAATPEPSSFALLGTGLLSVAGLMKRRFQA